MNDSNIPYNEARASQIPPGKPPEEVTYEKLVDIITQYIDRDSGNLNIMEDQSITRGLTKQLPSKLTIHRFIQGLNMLIHDYICSTNKNNTLKHNIIISEYFNGVNSMSKVLDNVDIEVADTEFLCYIIGYIFKMLKHFKEDNQNI